MMPGLHVPPIRELEKQRIYLKTVILRLDQNQHFIIIDRILDKII